jgi:hypothetical protein
MKIPIDIPDHQAPCAQKVLKSLSFVKKVKPMGASAAELWSDLQEAADDVRLH